MVSQSKSFRHSWPKRVQMIYRVDSLSVSNSASISAKVEAIWVALIAMPN